MSEQSFLNPENFKRYAAATMSADDQWITLRNGQHIMLDKENYTVVQYRDINGKSLKEPKVTKYKNYDDVQAHAQNLLTQGLKQHDFTIWAPAK